jgi:hypothetical protein
MIRQAYVGTRPRFVWLAALSATGLLACVSPSSNGGGTGGSGSGTGGSSSGTGGSSSGTGGSHTGGSNGTGGSSSGAGGSNPTGTGGSHTGGSNGTGGSSSGTGGSSSGTGGSSSGTGGSSSGTGGSSSGTGGTGGAFTGSDPPGYYKTADWNVTSVDWHGCVWTGIDSTVSGSTTSIMPQDFTAASKEGGPYEVKGTVYNDYNAVAMLGFNLNEAATSSSTQCKYNAAAASEAGPPAGTIPSSATGIAVNWSASVAPPTSFRIQIQGTDGATNANHRWCATITDASGPSFVPFSSFYTQCWNVGSSSGSSGNKYMNEDIDAVVFLVPGTTAQKAGFDFTIVGFAPGTSKSDAPGMAAACGTTMGTLGSSTASMAASMQRAKLTGTDCKQYIVQNNNWGQPTSTTQIINYTGTGFTIQSATGSSSGQGVPASFPSTYVGANGDIANGTYNTWSDTGLPKQISSMTSAMTSFGWSGGTGSKNFNATYDVWFAKSTPTAGSYNDAVSGFIMVWFYKPANNQPIGKSIRTASIGGHSWNVWVGPRNTTATGTDGNGRPVISYVASDSGGISSLSFNLKDFIDDAVSHGSSDMSGGASGITQSFSSSWYLTDVFAGFEIWSGGDAAGLKSTGFSIAVK